MKHIAQVLHTTLANWQQSRPMQADFFPSQMPAAVGLPKKNGAPMMAFARACEGMAASARSVIAPDGNHGENTQ